jgi:hypothetical protein
MVILPHLPIEVSNLLPTRRMDFLSIPILDACCPCPPVSRLDRLPSPITLIPNTLTYAHQVPFLFIILYYYSLYLFYFHDLPVT